MKTNDMTDINQIADAVHQNAVEHGFHPKEQTEDEFIAIATSNLHGEVSELWEAHRGHKLRELCDKAEKMQDLGLPALTCIEEEYADIVIRALDNCRRLGVDIQRAIWIKHEYNRSRPFKHGKKN